MKLITLSLLALTFSASAFAAEQSDLRLLPKCATAVKSAVYKKYLEGDDTASITGMKLLYGGSKGGTHYSPVVLVRTSDEVEPRDILVVASVSGDAEATKLGCVVRVIRTLEDGMLPEVDGLDK